MSLFIVSQNKKQIKKLTDSIEIKDNIEFNPNNPNGIQEPKYVSSSIFVDGQCFATYSTEEQAIKIVQEIKKFIAGKTVVKDKIVSSKARKEELEYQFSKSTAFIDDNVDVKSIDIDYVYEMPQIMPNKAVESPRKHESPPTQ